MTSTLLLRLGCIAVAGAAGALARYGVSHGMDRLFGNRWCLGTLAVNVAGCLVMGLLFRWFEGEIVQHHYARFLLMTGFLGSFTTFSTFALDTHTLLVQQGPYYAVGNIVLNLVLGGGALVAGLLIGDLL